LSDSRARWNRPVGYKLNDDIGSEDHER